MTRVWLLAFALSAVSACSWLVDPENLATKCKVQSDGTDPCGPGLACVEGACIAKCVLIDGEPDPCPKGQSCTEGICKAPCTASSKGELCGDNIDNDCDGKTDEQDPLGRDACGDKTDNDCDGKTDEGHDQDGDKNDWCGDPYMANGGGLRDCDDRNPTVFANAPERCDGIDNDCDNVTDETSDGKSLCDTGEECVGQRCVVPSCAIPGSSVTCKTTEMCDVLTGKCVPRGCDEAECNAPGEYCDQASGECRTERRDNGESCGANSDCKSASCIESAALKLKVASERICGQTCCQDSECPEGQRCFTAGTGARSCLPTGDVPVPASSPPLCTFDTQCRDGQVCSIEDNQSIEGSIVESRDDLTTTVCRTPGAGEGTLGDSCGPFSGTQCASNYCYLPNGSFFGVCSQACRVSSDCAALAEEIGSGTKSYCRFVTTNFTTRTQDYYPECVIGGSEVGSGKPGDECGSGRECQEGGCVGAVGDLKGQCAATCCNDAQCGFWGEFPTLCRPVAFGNDHYETRCVP